MDEKEPHAVDKNDHDPKPPEKSRDEYIPDTIAKPPQQRDHLVQLVVPDKDKD
jgi:hypothetical protein